MTGTLNAKKIAKYFIGGFWNVGMVGEALEKGVITQAEYDKIIILPVKGQ